MESILVIVLSLAVFQGGLLAFSLWVKKEKSVANQILAVWIVLLIIDIFMVILTVKKFHVEYPGLMGVRYGWPLLHGLISVIN